MSFHGYDPGDRNNWYQSPQLGLFPVSPAVYGGGISAPSYPPPPSRFPLQPSYPLPPQFPFQPSYSPPPPHSQTIINGYTFPPHFPYPNQTHMSTNQLIYPHSQAMVKPEFPSFQPQYALNPSIPTVQSPSVPIFVQPQPQFTDPIPPSSICSMGNCEPLAPITGRIRTISSSSSSSSDPQTHEDTTNPHSLPPLSSVSVQQEVLRSKPAFSALIDKLEMLCQPLSVIGTEEISLASLGRNPDEECRRDDAIVPKGTTNGVHFSSTPELYPELVSLNTVPSNLNLLSHDNLSQHSSFRAEILEELGQLQFGPKSPVTESASSPLKFGSLPAGSVALTAANGSSSMLSASSRGIRISEKPNLNLSPHEVILGLNKNFITEIHSEHTTTAVVTEELVLNVDKNIAGGIHSVKFSDIADGEDDNEDKDDEGGNECVIFGSSAASKKLLKELQQESNTGSDSGAESYGDHSLSYNDDSQRVDGKIVTVERNDDLMRDDKDDDDREREQNAECSQVDGMSVHVSSSNGEHEATGVVGDIPLDIPAMAVNCEDVKHYHHLVTDLNNAGDVVDRWIGRTGIRSCCKLSYEHAQDIIDGKFNSLKVSKWQIIISESFDTFKDGCPQIHGQFEWSDVIRYVKNLYEVSKTVKERRFSDGALQLDNSKVVILFDEYGDPYDSLFSERKESNSLVEEFMLLANRTAAEVISRAFPNSALLRRHLEPNMCKLKEFEAFCSKHGLELDTSSSGRFHQSLERFREKLKDDSVLFNILMNYATKPMQLATYFCSGELKHKENDWGHYGLAVPLYTHFTSPLRRYPDIVVHRTLAAAIEAEELYLEHQRLLNNLNRGDKFKMRCFTGVHFDKDAAESRESQEALLATAMKHRVPNTELLTDVAAHCNVRKLASRHVKDACDKLHIWSLLKKKEILLSEARVMGLGPRFMSIYIQKLVVERRINYDEVEGLMVEWLDATSTLVLSFKRMEDPKSDPDHIMFLAQKDDHFLDWNTRFSIALGTAERLAYLREECNEKIVYCDIKVLDENGMLIVHWRSIGRQSCFYLQGDFVSFYISAFISIISEGYLEFGTHLHYANSYSTVLPCNPCSSFKFSEFFRQAILYKNLLFLAAATHALSTKKLSLFLLTGYYYTNTLGQHTDTRATTTCGLQCSLPRHEDMPSFKGGGLLGSQCVLGQ